jgi:hypothetical protein
VGRIPFFVKPGGTYSNGQALKQSSTVSSFVTAVKYDYMFRLKLTVVIINSRYISSSKHTDRNTFKNILIHLVRISNSSLLNVIIGFLCDFLMLPTSHLSKSGNVLPTVESKWTDPHTVEPHWPSVFVPLLITDRETSSGDGNLASSRSASIPSLVGGEDGVGNASMSLRSPLCSP